MNCILGGNSSTDGEAQQSRRDLCEPFHLVPPSILGRNYLNCVFIVTVMIAEILKTSISNRPGKMGR
jgi:hypothetical protein